MYMKYGSESEQKCVEMYREGKVSKHAQRNPVHR